jgi:hypothetical protein
MPSDERTTLALAAVAPRIARFRNAAAAGVEQARSFVASHAANEGERVGHVTGELGAFAAGRLDVGRFAVLFGSSAGALPADARRAVERGIGALEALLARGDAPFVVTVPTGGSLRDAVSRALDACGQVFGSALVIEYARQGIHAPEHLALLDSFPFRRWNRAERRLAPPLVVEVDGADLAAGALAEFVDGGVTLVLVVRGPCAPAPLVRLVTPATFVMQTDDAKALERVATLDGPAVVALVGDGAARFTHDPAAGSAPWRRFAVLHVPTAPTRPLGGASAWQQQEDLAQLAALSARPADALDAGAVAPESARAALSTDPTDRLAAWLLSQAGESGT